MTANGTQVLAEHISLDKNLNSLDVKGFDVMIDRGLVFTTYQTHDISLEEETHDSCVTKVFSNTLLAIIVLDMLIK